MHNEKTTIFIDGSSGTAGLRIYDRLAQREDIDLLTLPPELHHDMEAQRELINRADIAFLCLPDAAAITAAERGKHVLLLEKNAQLGRKIRITGKGRCNVTNHCDVKTILANIPGDGRFLYSALNRLGPQDTMALFESLGVPLKTERGNRVFPVSDRSHDVANALERAYAHAGGKVVHAAATDILTQDGAVSAVVTTEGAIDCDAAVICTGGLSYPLTGSTGDGYRFAQRLGHTVTPTRASLVPLESEDPWCAEMQGFSLRNVTLTVYDEQNKAVYSDLGEMLFTHFGVSGPLVLSASAHMRDFRGTNTACPSI